jgi:hypothetical protein
MLTTGVSAKHLKRYRDEFSFRFNLRDEQAKLFFYTVARMVGTKKLSYKRLIAYS